RSGKPAQAEKVYVRLLHEHPTVPLVLSLLEAHDRARLLQKLSKMRDDTTSGMGLPDADAAMSEAAVDALLAELPEEIGLVGCFSRGLRAGDTPAEVHEKIVQGAEREPPMPWANHLLGREAEREGKHAEAAVFFEKEGTSFEERRVDIERAFEIWIGIDAW